MLWTLNFDLAQSPSGFVASRPDPPEVVVNSSCGRCFFPVDNRSGVEDEVGCTGGTMYCFFGTQVFSANLMNFKEVTWSHGRGSAARRRGGPNQLFFPQKVVRRR